jgi:broad specificity phosphatase PhoE
MNDQERHKFYPAEERIRKKYENYYYRPPQGESGMDLDIRIISFVESLPQDSCVFVSGHGRWILSLCRLVAGDRIDTFEAYHTGKFPKNASLTIIQPDEDRGVSIETIDPVKMRKKSKS